MSLPSHLAASLRCLHAAPSAPRLPSLPSLASSSFPRHSVFPLVHPRNARRNPRFSSRRQSARVVRARASGVLPADVDAIIARGREAGAFVEHSACVVPGATDGPLRGLTFAVKDMYDVRGGARGRWGAVVAGVPTGFGNPTWLATHDVPQATAPVVQALLEAGASVVGKAAMDELAFSLAGENAHYGTPLNPKAPLRIPGGSSSGSAAAVAAGLVDFALGSDTAGSVRIPANHCGVWGIRTSHARLPLTGAQPLQPSMDTVGWFARDASVLQRVGSTLFHSPSLAPSPSSTSSSPSSSSSSSPSSLRPFTGWLVAEDAFELADKDAARAIYDKISPHIDEIAALLGGRPEEKRVAGEEGSEVGGVHEWVDAMRVLQLIEVCQCHRQWITFHHPDFYNSLKYHIPSFSSAPVLSRSPSPNPPADGGVAVPRALMEAWQCHGQWITAHRPAFGPGVAQRFQAASAVDPQGEAVAHAREKRAGFTSHMESLVAGGKLLMLPAAPSIAPLKAAPPADVDSFRVRTLALTVIGGAAGLPQVTVPLTRLQGSPLGLGLVAARGWDEELLALAVRLQAILDLSV
ncbi:unnamed protein product [Closterium sp. NIES-65]|nr:unnamed protein product [Closterium sp. NIES-65]